jgi:hypothetical protein
MLRATLHAKDCNNTRNNKDNAHHHPVEPLVVMVDFKFIQQVPLTILLRAPSGSALQSR